MFLMDFWNDGEFAGGCVAGGRQYCHINARGDVEPCAFIHYSNVNIKDMSLKEALKQPIFEEYRKNQPFNHNHLRPCPCLDNPEQLRKMVHASEAKSTQINDMESVENLTQNVKIMPADGLL
jgi:radical SAM protein with 4Fe4S-binding SPASM domain